MVCPPCLCGRMLVYYDIQSVSFFLHKNKVLVVDCETGCLFNLTPAHLFVVWDRTSKVVQVHLTTTRIEKFLNIFQKMSRCFSRKMFQTFPKKTQKD